MPYSNLTSGRCIVLGQTCRGVAAISCSTGKWRAASCAPKPSWSTVRLRVAPNLYCRVLQTPRTFAIRATQVLQSLQTAHCCHSRHPPTPHAAFLLLPLVCRTAFHVECRLHCRDFLDVHRKRRMGAIPFFAACLHRNSAPRGANSHAAGIKLRGTGRIA